MKKNNKNFKVNLKNNTNPPRKTLSFYLSYIIPIFLGLFIVFKIFFVHFFVNNKQENSYVAMRSKKKKLLIVHDYLWYKKQNKYLHGGSLMPVSFMSKINEKDTENTLKRNGWLYTCPNAKATVLVCHGFMTSKDDMAFLRHILSDCNVLTFDFRAHGESNPSQCCTLGNDERIDVVSAVNYIRSNKKINNVPLIVYGFSMGAVASIMAQSDAEKKEESLFDGAIWDCPFESSEQLVSRAFSNIKMTICGFNFMIPGVNFFKRYVYHPVIQSIFKFILKHFARKDTTQIDTFMRPISPNEAISQITIPLFLIGCHNDEKAPPSAILNLYNNAVKSSYRRLWISSGRHHFDSFFVNPEKYVYKMKIIIQLNYFLFKHFNT